MQQDKVQSFYSIGNETQVAINTPLTWQQYHISFITLLLPFGWLYNGESVNTSRKTCEHSKLRESIYPPPTLIYLSRRFISVLKPAAQKSFDYCLGNFRTSVSTLSSSAKRLPPRCEPLYATNTFHRKQVTFLYQYPLPTKPHNRTLLFGSTLFKHDRQFHYRNQPLNMSMRICYPDSHEAGLCCYLVIHTENLLRPLQLFYFHFWPIYWLSLVWWRC
jgi:hypothetical protein